MIDFNDTPIVAITSLPEANPLEIFKGKLIENRIPIPATILIDGEIHKEGKRGKFYYSLHQGKNALFGMMGDWSRHGKPIAFSSANLKELSASDLAEHEAILAANRKTLKAEKKRKQAAAAKAAAEIWEDAQIATEHEYLTSKKIPAHGLKLSKKGELLVPMRDTTGKLCSLQKIKEVKKFLFGGKVKGCSHTILGDSSIMLCEGYSTAATIHAATGSTCIIAFNSGNLKNVAAQIKKNFTICADNDQWNANNTGVHHAEKAAKVAQRNGLIANVIIPTFADTTSKPTDFNDLFSLEGIEAVRRQLLPPNPLQKVCLNITELINMDIPEEKCFLQPWLKVNSISEIYGWRGCGKTWFVLSLLDAVTRGKKFLGWDCQESAPCLYLDAEMTMRDDQKRAGLLGLGAKRANPLYLLSNEHLVKSGMPAIKLISEDSRKQLKELLLEKKIKLWVADNISSLSPGGNENDKQDWDEINQWLLDLRFHGISTILLHHSNKSGGQRGTSAREDNLDSVVNLQQPDDYVTEDGARVIVHFEKNRGVDSNDLSKIADMDIKVRPQRNGKLGFNYAEKNTKIDAQDAEILWLLGGGTTEAEITGRVNLNYNDLGKKIQSYLKHGLLTDTNQLTEKGQKLLDSA